MESWCYTPAFFFYVVADGIKQSQEMNDVIAEITSWHILRVPYLGNLNTLALFLCCYLYN
jgi:hypothetical protein